MVALSTIGGELKIPDRRLADFQRQILRDLSLPTLGLNFDMVTANRKCGHLIMSRAVGLRGSFDARGSIAHDDLCVRYDGAKLIDDGSLKRGSRLGHGRRVKE